MQPETKRFTDFCKEILPLDGTKIGIEDVLDQEIKIIAYRIKRSKYGEGTGEYLTLQIEIEEDHRVLFTGSSVLIDQFKKYGNEIPFLTTIRKIDRYYTLT